MSRLPQICVLRGSIYRRTKHDRFTSMGTVIRAYALQRLDTENNALTPTARARSLLDNPKQSFRTRPGHFARRVGCTLYGRSPCHGAVRASGNVRRPATPSPGYEIVYQCAEGKIPTMKKLLCGFLLLVSACVHFTLAGAASVTLGQAGPGGVSAIITPDSGESGQPAKIWMGVVWNGALYLRNGPTNWAQYQGGPLPIALTSAALPSSLQVSIVNIDISSLPGLDVYVGYGSTEADLSLSGHLAKVYTVPGAPVAGADINLQPQLDTAHAVSKLVTIAGGATLITTGADGSQYTLTLPPNSVLFDVRVTMTPITALGGLSASGGLKAGVHLEPDGMSLGVPATLDIVPASLVPVTEEISFSYSGNGKQAYAYGMGVNASRTRFTILHFSGWAIGRGTDAQRAAMFQSHVDSATNRILQSLAPIIYAERQRQLQSLAPIIYAERQRQLLGTPSDEGSPEFFAEMQRALEDRYTDVVKPAMDNAEARADSGDIDAVAPALQAFLAWDRLKGVLSIDILQAERAALVQQFERIMDKLRINMRDRCFNQHDLSMAVQLIGLARQQALLFGTDSPAFADAQKCLTFKLNFESALMIGVGNSNLRFADMFVRALGVPVKMGPVSTNLPVSQPIELLVFTGDPPLPECTVSPNVHVSGPFKIESGNFVYSTVAGKMEITDVELNIEPGDIVGSIIYTCVIDGQTVVEPPIQVLEGFLFGVWTSFHLGAPIVGWDMIRGAEFASKTYQRNSEIGYGTEHTLFDLIHAPE